MSFTIEAGREYRTRGGSKAYVEDNCGTGGSHYPWKIDKLSGEKFYHVLTGAGKSYIAEPSYDLVAPWPSAADIPDGYEDTGEFRKPRDEEPFLHFFWAAHNGYKRACFGCDGVEERHILRKVEQPPAQEGCITSADRSCTCEICQGSPPKQAERPPPQDHDMIRADVAGDRRRNLSLSNSPAARLAALRAEVEGAARLARARRWAERHPTRTPWDDCAH